MEARLTEIPVEEALRYMGVRGVPDPRLAADAARCRETLFAEARPRAVWRVFPLRPDGALDGTAFRLEGRDVRSWVRGADRVILMAATLGAETETLIRRAQRRDMADAMILDALASAAIENVCDNLCADLAREMAPASLTGRFSPGYGDFPLARQKELCAVLNVSRALGISLTPGGLMIPQKSVTAVLGVLPPGCGSGAETGPACARCTLSDQCTFRKEDLSDE